MLELKAQREVEFKEQKPAPLTNLDEQFLDAVREGRVKDARQLLTAGANKEALEPKTGNTALFIATSLENKAMIKMLCQSAIVNVDVANIYGDTALHRALKRRYAEGVKLLLQYGANLHIRNVKDETPDSLGAKHFPLVWKTWKRVLRSKDFSLFNAASRPSLALEAEAVNRYRIT